LDVTDPASIVQAIEIPIDRFGTLDAVINNAGYGQYGIFETIPQASIQGNFDVNVFGVMNVIRAISQVFREQKAGLILNVSSVGGLIGLPSISIYLSTKFALEASARCRSNSRPRTSLSRSSNPAAGTLPSTRERRSSIPETAGWIATVLSSNEPTLH
jgi:NAD(P)-dependent dehydrogenase (short-subunit alcohol dehydrogenase family)